MTTIYLKSHVKMIGKYKGEPLPEPSIKSVQLHTFVNQINNNEAEEELPDPSIKSVDLNSCTNNFVSNYSIEFRSEDERDLSSQINKINTNISMSKIKTISINSHSKKLTASIRTVEALTDAQIRELGSHMSKVVSNYSTETYQHPVTYKALIQHVENKSNTYHIE